MNVVLYLNRSLLIISYGFYFYDSFNAPLKNALFWFQLFKNIQHSNFTQLVSRLCRSDSKPLRKNETYISFKLDENEEQDPEDI